MNNAIIINFINNIALLMALGIMYDAFFTGKPGEKSASSQILLGLILGCIGVAIMLNPWEYDPGIYFDTRSVLLSVTGYFFGAIPTLITIAITAGYRVVLGGSGAWTGVAVIVTSGMIGLAWRSWQKKDLGDVTSGNLYALGLATHVLMLLWMLTLPRSVSFTILSKISLPVLLIFPLGTVLLGKLMLHRFQRLRFAANLQESEAKYRHLYETMTQGVLLQDADGSIVEANPAACRILALARDQIIGKTTYDPRWRPIHEDGSAYDPAEMPARLALQSGKPAKNVSCGIYVPEKDEYRWLVADSVPRFKPGDDKAFGTMTILNDITDNKRMELSLVETEKRYRGLFENMTAGFVLFEVVQDAEGIPVDLSILAANKGFEITTGLPGKDVIGKRLTHVLPGIKSDAADWIATYGEIALTGKARHFEQGSELLGYFYSIVAYQAAPKQCAVTFIDISERRIMEKKLLESEHRFRATVEHIPNVIVIYDTELKIKYINDATLLITGRPKSEFIGKRDADMWPPEIYNSWLPILEKTRKTGQPHSVETNLKIIDDFYLRITCIPLLDNHGSVQEIMGITEDLTDLKRSEEEIRNFTAYLQNEIEKEKITISREIHDDLGPTMTALKLDIGWLKRRLSGDQVQIAEKLDTMLTTLNVGMRTVKKICTELRPGILDDMGIGAALEWYVSRFQEKTGIVCHLVVDPSDMELRPQLSTALFRIQQEALTNISRHAGATEVFVKLTKHDSQIHMLVEDNGKGLDEFAQKTEPSFGIIGMRERVLEFEGDFSIKNRETGGVIVEVKIST